jgi:nucleolar protein 56
LKTIIFVHEAGVSFLDEKLNVIDKVNYKKNPALEYRKLLEGAEYNLIEEVLNKIKHHQIETVLVQSQELKKALSDEVKADVLTDEMLSKIFSEKMRIILESGFAESEEKAFELLREFSLKQSELKITEESTRLDLQAMQAVLALDELDKMINILGTRVKEWYEIHFPEILQFYEDPVELCKFISDIGDRRNLDEEKLERTRFSDNKKKALLNAAQKSRGGIFREEDMEHLLMLSNHVKETYEIRKRMSNLVENVMKQIAPNLTQILGATIGARLIAKAGGLEKLAVLPSSTIQILGAEKAIFRAIKTGARPPKHGIIFQHTLIHDAKKWQRGRIARALAAKIAIAARVDLYRRELDPSIEKSLASRINEIRKSKEKVREEEKVRPKREFKKFRGRKR